MKLFLLTQFLLTTIFSTAGETTQLPAQPNALIYILAAIATGGGITGLVSYLRLKKQGAAEKEEIITRAAEQAVNALQASLTRLQQELERAKTERDEIEEKFDNAIERREALERKVFELNSRIEQLEKSIIGFKSKEAFIKSVSATYDGIFLVHIPSGEIQYANPAACIMLDYMFDGMTDMRFDELVAPNLRSEYQQIKLEFIKNPSSVYTNKKIKDLKLLTRTNHAVDAELKFTPLENNMSIITAREIH